jgi:hypothetical protein
MADPAKGEAATTHNTQGAGLKQPRGGKVCWPGRQPAGGECCSRGGMVRPLLLPAPRKRPQGERGRAVSLVQTSGSHGQPRLGEHSGGCRGQGAAQRARMMMGNGGGRTWRNHHLACLRARQLFPRLSTGPPRVKEEDSFGTKNLLLWISRGKCR